MKILEDVVGAAVDMEAAAIECSGSGGNVVTFQGEGWWFDSHSPSFVSKHKTLNSK